MDLTVAHQSSSQSAFSNDGPVRSRNRKATRLMCHRQIHTTTPPHRTTQRPFNNITTLHLPVRRTTHMRGDATISRSRRATLWMFRVRRWDWVRLSMNFPRVRWSRIRRSRFTLLRSERRTNASSSSASSPNKERSRSTTPEGISTTASTPSHVTASTQR